MLSIIYTVLKNNRIWNLFIKVHDIYFIQHVYLCVYCEIEYMFMAQVNMDENNINTMFWNNNFQSSLGQE